MNMNKFSVNNDPSEQVIQNHGINPTQQLNSRKASAPTINRKLLDGKTLDALTGLSTSSRYRYIKKGLLPQPVRWPGCKNLWDFQEVCAYIERNNANARMALPPLDKVEEVEGLAYDIFLVNDLKNKGIEAPYTSSTTGEKSDELQGGQS